MTEQPLVIAIDGPAGSGKSTVAKAVAIRLGLEYLDTGAMYRSVAFAALRGGVDPEDAEVIGNLSRNIELEIAPSGSVVVDGVDATIEIRGPEVTRAVSIVAANARRKSPIFRTRPLRPILPGAMPSIRTELTIHCAPPMMQLSSIRAIFRSIRSSTPSWST